MLALLEVACPLAAIGGSMRPWYHLLGEGDSGTGSEELLLPPTRILDDGMEGLSGEADSTCELSVPAANEFIMRAGEVELEEGIYEMPPQG